MSIVEEYNLALKILYSMQSSHFSEIRIESGKWKLHDKEYNYDRYFPMEGKPKGVIIGVHGMSPYGHRDDRIVNVARAFASIGFGFYLPEIPDIRDANFNPKNIEEIRLMMQLLITQYGKIGVFAPSFSGGMVLASAADSSVRNSITSIMTIGAYIDGKSVLQNLIENPKADPYAMLIIFKNVGFDLIGRNRKVHKALELAVITDSGKRDPKPLPEYLNSLGKEDRILAEKVIFDSEYRLHLLRQVGAITEELGKKMNIDQYLDKVEAPIVLLHGDEDNVIEPSQSRLAYEKLKQWKKKVRLDITPFISHGDSGLKLSKIPELVRLVNSFKFFIHYALR